MTFEKFLKENNIQIDLKLSTEQKDWVERYAQAYLQRYYGV